MKFNFARSAALAVVKAPHVKPAHLLQECTEEEEAAYIQCLVDYINEDYLDDEYLEGLTDCEQFVVPTVKELSCYSSPCFSCIDGLGQGYFNFLSEIALLSGCGEIDFLETCNTGEVVGDLEGENNGQIGEDYYDYVQDCTDAELDAFLECSLEQGNVDFTDEVYFEGLTECEQFVKPVVKGLSCFSSPCISCIDVHGEGYFKSLSEIALLSGCGEIDFLATCETGELVGDLEGENNGEVGGGDFDIPGITGPQSECLQGEEFSQCVENAFPETTSYDLHGYCIMWVAALIGHMTCLLDCDFSCRSFGNAYIEEIQSTASLYGCEAPMDQVPCEFTDLGGFAGAGEDLVASVGVILASAALVVSLTN